MSGYEVSNPILNSPYDEPAEYWRIEEGQEPVREAGRRKAMYYYRDPKTKPDQFGRAPALQIELLMVNRIRQRVKAWRDEGYPGASRITLELLNWWRRDGRRWRLFFAQLEAVETIIFLTEARADFKQGVQVAREQIPAGQDATGFLRYACKMATGAGKTAVMGMLAAWSILNKLNALLGRRLDRLPECDDSRPFVGARSRTRRGQFVCDVIVRRPMDSVGCDLRWILSGEWSGPRTAREDRSIQRALMSWLRNWIGPSILPSAMSAVSSA